MRTKSTRLCAIIEIHIVWPVVIVVVVVVVAAATAAIIWPRVLVITMANQDFIIK